MPCHFWWRPNNAPVSRRGGRINLGLDLGGDIDRSDNFSLRILGWPAPGYVYLREVEGSQSGRGAREISRGRIIACFHGNFHRDASARPNRRITFEIDTGGGVVPSHEERVRGFDPECIFGVDALVLTFVNREFHINLPFFIDTQSEGDKLEIEAVARVHSHSRTLVMGTSAPLRLTIRRQHSVVTTTPARGGGNLRYTGDLIGHLICHHEKYLLDGAFKNRSRRWPRVINPRLFEVPWSGEPFAIPFDRYASGSLKILLLEDLLDECVPDAQFFQENAMGGAMRGTDLVNRTRRRIRQRTAADLINIFEDAGFTGVQVWWQNEQQAASLVRQFTRHFRQSRNGWTLRNRQQPLSIPFWTFIVAQNSRIRDVGHSETTVVRHTTTRSQTGNREYMLPYPAPIGSGNKDLTTPINIRAMHFRNDITDRQYRSDQEIDQRADSVGSKFAVTIAHEIGHSLGLMHPAVVRASGPYYESEATPLFTVMCSTVDSGAYGIGMKFSHQDKVIWERAFGVQPNWNVTGMMQGLHLLNKTWGSNWQSTDWSERRGRLMRRHGEVSIMVLDLRTGQRPPPFAGRGRRVQRGTHVP